MTWHSEPAAAARPGLLRQAFALMLLRRPRGAATPLGAGAFAAVAALAFVLHGTLDYALTEPPRAFSSWAVAPNAVFALLALALGTAAARLLERPALALGLAALLLFATLPAQLVLRWAFYRALLAELQGAAWIVPLAFAHAIAIVLRLFQWTHGALRARAWAAAALVFAALYAWVTFVQPPLPLWWTDYDDEEEYAEEDAEPAFDPETLIYAQPAQVDRALERLAPQRPDAIDLYAIGFGGDGSESVFRNEVEYFATLMERRFGAAGRTLRLINHPATLDRDPLATLHNLRHALAGVGRTIDRDQDIVLLFLTSHGSDDHELYVSLEPLPLRQIDPVDLRAALDDAGIRWRVLVVSACYSGGFIDALESPDTLVITAARADRPSFGCGAQSDITWFGQAFLTEALNETGDFADAFARAKKRVRTREREEGEDPSHPQLRAGEAITAQLQRWQAQTTLGAAVQFEPAQGD